MSSKKPKRILPNGLENGVKIYRKSKDFRSNLKTKVEINIDDLRKKILDSKTRERMAARKQD